MKVTVLKENLHQAVNTVSRFIATKAQLPVLGNVLITADKQLKLSATNLETGINYWIGAKIDKEGSISIPARLFAEFVASLPPEKVELEIVDNSLFLKSGGFQASFIGIGTNEFPIVPTNQSQPKIALACQNLAKIFSQVIFAAAQDESRPVLGGILLKIKDGELVAVATDGYRLSLKKIKEIKGVEKIEEFKNGLLIPAKTLTEIGRLIDEKKSETLGMTITPESNQVIFSLNEAEVVSRLIEGDFPDYEKIIPTGNTTKVTFEKEEFLRAVKMASLFARESANIIKLDINSKTVKIMANAPQLGDNISEIVAKTEGEETKIAFNAKYLLDFLAVAGSETITLKASGPLNPGVFTVGSDNTYLHIIMPVRVQE